MDDDIELDEKTWRKIQEELRDPETMRALCEGLQRRTAKLDRVLRRVDSYWLPEPSPHWPERLAYERRRVGSGARHDR